MDNIKASNFNEYFKKLYEERGYLDKYGIDVLITSLMFFVFFIAISYFYIMSKVEPIKNNWDAYKCHPGVIPFAGHIINPPDQSPIEFTSENFGRCVNQVLATIVGQFIKPIYYLSDKIVGFFNKLVGVLLVFRKLMAYIRNKFKKIITHLMNKIVNVFIPVQKIIIKFKDALAKTVGVMTAGLYTVMSGYLALKSFMGSFLSIIIAVLVLAVVAIIALWILPFTWPLAASGTVFFLLISIPTSIIAGWMIHILNLTSRSVPSKPGKPACFDKNTLIKTISGEIMIKDLKPGMELNNGVKVNATFKCALNGQKMYKINNIIVSETHKVFHDKLGWIYTSEHPEAIQVKDYREPYIYCLNTDTKRIEINGIKFLDWDDLEPIDIIKLKNLNYLTHNCSLRKIHKNLDSGLDADTKVELMDGHNISIKKIKVNDNLRFGEKVLAVVKINADDISFIKKYKFNDNILIGAPNILLDDIDLGRLKTLNIPASVMDTKHYKNKYLYHLITDKGTFVANGIKIYDYNSAIENIIDKREEFLNKF